jgi:hypothetical protein
MTDKICTIKPKRAIVYENGRDITYVKPCGVKYLDKHEVHCSKYGDRTCEYMALEHVKKQQNEAEEIARSLLDDFYGGC